MRVRLEPDALLRVSDQAGRIVRRERLPAGTALRERLRTAHENYPRQGWTVGALPARQWAAMAEKGDRRLLIAIRWMPPAGLAGFLCVRQQGLCTTRRSRLEPLYCFVRY
jgi:hypothetical protein